MYVRFITSNVDRDSSQHAGVFHAAYRLSDEGRLPNYEHTTLRELLDWFKANLIIPDKFTSAKPPYYRKQNKAISWFKESATEHIAKIRQIVTILEDHDIRTEMIRTDRPGYIVYEDAHQIVAEAFSDSIR